MESGDLIDPKPEDGKWEIDLSGRWKYKTAAVMSPLPEQTFFQYKPTAIYNGEWKHRGGVSNKVASEWKHKGGVSNKVASEWKHNGGVSNKVAS